MNFDDDAIFSRLQAALVQVQGKLGPFFYAWSLSARETHSLQSLLVGIPRRGFDSSQEREVRDRHYAVTVYVRHSTPERMGVASKVIDPLSPFDAQIERTCQDARLVGNPVWNLLDPPAVPYRDVATADPLFEKGMPDLHARLRAEAAALARDAAGVHVNSGELYLNRHQHRVTTSHGVHMAWNATDIYFEVAMEKLPLPNQQEVLRYHEVISADELHLADFFNEVREETLCLGATELPPTTASGVILVSAEVAGKLFAAVRGQLGAEAEYERGPHLKPGDMVPTGTQLPDADLVNLTLDPWLPVMAESRPFTIEGIPSERARIISAGRVERQMVGVRMGQYLNRATNGIMGNLCVDAGSATRAELIASQPEVLEILTFASLLINPQTLTWSSEIKLGRLHRQGQPPRMIKGGIVSGDLRQNLAGCRLSKQLTRYNAIANAWSPACGYYGPDGLLFRTGVRIAGG